MFLLTSPKGDVIDDIMDAQVIYRRRKPLTPTAFYEAVIWVVPAPVRGSAHGYKYRLALVVDGACVLRYDNEAGKGDHRHVGERQEPYRFTTPEALLADFHAEVERMLK
tara:strand:- start:10203 stop:10529 length:327 start_codon:yes stop_codon:yes gene_type:complete